MSGGGAQSRRVLLVGAHLDGTWIDVPEREFTYRAPKPILLGAPTWLDQDDHANVAVPVPEFVEYRLEPLSIAIRTANAVVWIGVDSELFGAERDLAVIRALFQRDVAQLFRGSP